MKFILILCIQFIFVYTFAKDDKNSGAGILKKSLELMNSKKYAQAVPLLFKIGYSRGSSASAKQKTLAQQWLGVALMRLGYFQVAAFPLIATMDQSDSVISDKSLLSLMQITDQLKDKSLLNYAVSKVDLKTKSVLSQEMIYTKIAESFLAQNQPQKAEESYLQVLQFNAKNENALYQLGLAYLKNKNPKKAYSYFEQLETLYEKKSSLDFKKSLVDLTLARTFYQAKQWNNAVQYYREIPKNHELYRQSQLELAWTYFRMGRFRSALSAIETLQTPFYETYYDPESLLFRSVILIFLCQPEDAEIALEKYSVQYSKFNSNIQNWLSKNPSSVEVIKLIQQSTLNLKLIQSGYKPQFITPLPFYFVRSILEEKKIKSDMQVMVTIKNERRKYKATSFSKNKSLASFFEKIYSNRLVVAQKRLVANFKQSVLLKSKELEAFSGQYELIKYEAISSKKQQLKALTQMTDEEKENRIKSNEKINFYSENGFRYWPFQGEFWIDEIGNYQYIGENRCMNE